MCGIFGFCASHRSRFNTKRLKPLIDRLMRLDESRGKEASGVALCAASRITILKRPMRASALIRSSEYHALFEQTEREASNGRPDTLIAMGHTRMVTNGTADNHVNNQPVYKHGMLCFHNGIVVNEAILWKSIFHTKKSFEVDTEVIVSLTEHFRQHGKSLVEAVLFAFNALEGANSIALLARDTNALILISSNGSLFVIQSASGQEVMYASERYFLRQAAEHSAIKKLFRKAAIVQVEPNQGVVISLDTLQMHPFQVEDDPPSEPLEIRRDPPREIADIQPEPIKRVERSARWGNQIPDELISKGKSLVRMDDLAIASLRRCKRCILPETFPLIEFDENGECNYCRNHTPYTLLGKEKLLEVLKPVKNNNGQPDCLVPFSGGRDSSYALYYISCVLGMKPVAYTYDWGMVTDLARRNISRMCGKLKIEHILVSADIRRKRKNIRKNVSAWLRKPNLGTIPLFMAGDKQFFYYASALSRQMGIKSTLFSMNPLERTDFKSAFCGVCETTQKKMFWDLSGLNKLQLLFYYSRELLRNPAYLNSSLADSLRAYFSYYFWPKNFTLFYDYIGWDEKIISDTLIRDYNWEKAADIESTWRIGDGTAAFYNYIYYRIAGFTENDTFRSNQIRQGQISREEALEMVKVENQPRLESIRWYCDTIGIDWRQALARINAVTPLYLNPRRSMRPSKNRTIYADTNG